MVGEQHISADPGELGYDRVVDADTSHAHPRRACPPWPLLRDRPRRPFFLSVGFFETHRDYFEPTSVRDALYSVPPANLPDSPVTRHDMAAFKQSARSLDHGRRRRAERARRAGPGRRHARDPHHRPRAAVPGRQVDADRPRAGRAADHARPRRLPRRHASPTRSSPRSTSSRRSATLLGHRAGPTHLQGRSLLPAGAAASAREVNDADLRRAHLPRRLRPAARGPHAAAQVHPALRATATCPVLAEHRRQPEQGPAARSTGWPRRRGRARSSTTSLFDPNEAHNLADEP